MRILALSSLLWLTSSMPVFRAKASAGRSTGFAAIEALEKRGIRASASVVRLGDCSVMAEHNPDSRLTPASVTKVVLAAAALEKFGSEHAFTTRLYTTGTRKGGILDGDLVLEGAGDPYLTNEKLWFLATDVARLGIREVRGRLVLNTSLFGPLPRDTNRAAGEAVSTHAYDSPLSPVAVNFSVLAVVAGPGQRPGEAGSIALEPYPLDEVKLSGGVKTAANGPARVSVSRARLRGGDQLSVSGQVPVGALPVRVYRSVSNAEDYAGRTLRAFLNGAGVSVRGDTRTDSKPLSASARPLVAVEGFPLDWQLRGLFKVSNNFIGDMLTIQLDLDDARPRGATLAGGAKRLTAYQDMTNAESCLKADPGQNKGPPAHIESGSGLTPENRLSARDVTSVLARMYRNSREFPSFLSALPIPGSEGTVKRRFTSPEAAHLRTRLRAKTGTLTSPVEAVGLAGYSRLDDGDWVAFTVIVNGVQGRASAGVETLRDAIDADLARILPLEKREPAQ